MALRGPQTRAVSSRAGTWRVIGKLVKPRPVGLGQGTAAWISPPTKISNRPAMAPLQMAMALTDFPLGWQSVWPLLGLRPLGSAHSFGSRSDWPCQIALGRLEMRWP